MPELVSLEKNISNTPNPVQKLSAEIRQGTKLSLTIEEASFLLLGAYLVTAIAKQGFEHPETLFYPDILDPVFSSLSKFAGQGKIPLEGPLGSALSDKLSELGLKMEEANKPPLESAVTEQSQFSTS